MKPDKNCVAIILALLLQPAAAWCDQIVINQQNIVLELNPESIKTTEFCVQLEGFSPSKVSVSVSAPNTINEWGFWSLTHEIYLSPDQTLIDSQPTNNDGVRKYIVTLSVEPNHDARHTLYFYYEMPNAAQYVVKLEVLDFARMFDFSRINQTDTLEINCS